MYLSKLPIGPKVGPYGAHRRVCEALVEPVRPVWRRFDDHALIVSSSPLKTDEPGGMSKPYDVKCGQGQRVFLDLLANVTVDRDDRRHDPVVLAMQEHRQAGRTATWESLAWDVGISWLERRQERLGIEIATVDLCSYERIEVMRKLAGKNDFFSTSGSKSFHIGTIHFQFQGTVKDPDAFRRSLFGGVGHGKAWGCGLLLARAI